MTIKIRQEVKKDYPKTEETVRKSFQNETMSDQQEHGLVKKLRASTAFIPELSLVAVDELDNIVGYILLTNNKIMTENGAIDSLSLAPLAVLPEVQNQGIGTQLMQEGIKRAKEKNYDSIIVLGHQKYYSKFGFKPADLWKIKAPFDVPAEAFMALELTDNALKNISGTVQYPAAFTD